MALEEPDVHTVFSLLRDSLKADRNLRDQAVVTLSRYESGPGLFSRLMDIIIAEGLPSDDDVRLSASNYIKEAIMRYWGNMGDAIFYIDEYEKTNLRNKLLSHLPAENDEKIAQNLIKIISKIAYFDYPQEWPELLSVLAQKLEKGDRLTSHRILEVLSHIIPTLSKEDLRPEISSRLFNCCWQLWEEDEWMLHSPSMFCNSIEGNTSLGQHQDLTIERLLLCASIILMIIIFRFQDDTKYVKVPRVKEVCHAFIRSVEALVPFYSIVPNHPKLTFVQRFCTNLMNGLVEIQKWHWTFFGDVTVHDHMVVFCLNIIMSTGHEKNPAIEQLLIECMVMLKSVLRSISEPSMYDLPYFHDKRFIAEEIQKKRRVTTENRKRIIPNKVESLLPSLSSERVKDLCKILITRYVLLTEDDLMKWSRDPERFYHETNPYHEPERRAKLRPHAEALFIAVLRSYKQLQGPVGISILQEATNDRPAKETDSVHKMLLREAAYTALGHVFPRNCGELDFKKLFEGVLCPELHNGHPDMRIIHWKIAFFVQNWAYEVERDMRKPIFRALLKLLEYDDLVARLAAIPPLRWLFTDIDFQEEGFMDLLRSYFLWCFKLLKDVRDFRSKNIVLDCILLAIINIGTKSQEVSIITKIGEAISPFARQLAYEIEKAWEASTCNMNLQMTILGALRLLSELEILTPVCYKILSLILEMFVALNDPQKLCLLEKGMLLWESTISSAPSMNFQLQALFPYLQEIMKNTIDHIMHHLQVAIRIIDGYINLGGGRFLIEHASVIHKLLVGIYANVDLELKCGRGRNELETEVFNFGASIVDRVEAMKGDTNTSLEEQEDETYLFNVSRSFGIFPTMRVARILFKDWEKLEEISIRLAGKMPACQSFSAGVKELGETLMRVFIEWQRGNISQTLRLVKS